MKYISTRSAKQTQEFTSSSEAIINGLAHDGGLYAPEEIPAYNGNFLPMSYKELALDILSLYFTDYTRSELSGCIEKAYGTGFSNGLVAPVRKAGENYFLELFHGRTLAFKDMALSILPHLMIAAKKRLGIDKDIIILAATSGDTGSAALAGFAEVAGTKVIVFYPDGGVSPVQRLQMVTQQGDNIKVAAIRGNFDDAQKGVKRIFSDTGFNKELLNNGFLLSSANSINIGRLVPQIVYYYYAYAQMVNNGWIKQNDKLNFSVPTGNFGNILAAYYACKMGLPIGNLVCASNSNKVLYDFFNSGVYDTNRKFNLTVSPSMDILVSSNLERLLYDLCGGDGNYIKALMDKLAHDGKYEFALKSSIIKQSYATELETYDAIRHMYENGYIIDTHTAVAYAAANKPNLSIENGNKTVIVSTASPYKFAPSVVKAVCGKDYDGVCALAELEKISCEKMPPILSEIITKKIIHGAVIEKEDMQGFIKAF